MKEESIIILEKRLKEIKSRRIRKTAFKEVMQELLLEVDQHFKPVQEKIQGINAANISE